MLDFDGYEMIREWESDGFRLELFDTHEPPTDRRWFNETALAYRFYDDGRLIFSGADYRPGASIPIDSDRSVAGLLGFLSLRPGDTDSDYFADYSPEQLAWCQDRAEELSIIQIELEEQADDNE